MASTSTVLAPAAGRKPRAAVPWTWRLQNFITSYLPVLLMAALAGGTWWLVKNTPSSDEAIEVAPARHDPDYRMNDFSMERIGTDGRLRGRIEGREMRHYPDTDTLEIDNVKLRAIGEDGSITLASAHRGVSNSDGSDMQLFGDVLVQRFVNDDTAAAGAPQLTVRGEFLQALADSETLRSHLPVTITYGGMQLQTQSFVYDHLHALLKYTGHTTGRFEPAALKATKKKSSP